MRRTFSLVFLAMVFAATGGARAQESSAEDVNGRARPLALSAALEVAVRQNADLERASIDIDKADAAALTAEGLDEWMVTGDLSVLARRTTPIPGQQFQITRTDQVQGSAGLARSFAFGGSVGITFDASFTRTTSLIQAGTVSNEADSSNYFGGVSLNYVMPLMRGLGERVARSLQWSARLQQNGAQLRRELAALGVVRDIVRAYWELAYLTDDLEIRRSSLELAHEQLRITRAGIEAGAKAPTEALAVEQAIAVRDEAILLAEVGLAEQSLALRQLVGLEVGPGEIQLQATDAMSVPEAQFDLDATIVKALEHSPQLALLAVDGESAALEVALAIDDLKPRLDFSAAVGPTGNNDTVPGAVERLVTFDDYTVTASLRFEQAIGRSAAHGRYASARADQARVEVDVEQLRRDVAASVVRAVNLVRTANKRVAVTKKSIELATQNLDAEKLRFEAGHATNFDVLQRQNELQEARLSNARAAADYLRAVADVEYLTGDLLPRYGINISDDAGGTR